MASCPKASSSVRHTKGGRGQGTDDGSRWRCPARPLGFNAVGKNGSAASELAADAYPCIMVWVFGPPHKRMWHDASCTNPQLPSDFVIPTTASVPSCSEPSSVRVNPGKEEEM